MAESRSQLQLHLEPKQPIEIYELSAALNSLARQYNLFVERQTYFRKGGEGRLLVSSVAPGGIDIGFIPDLSNAVAVAAPVISDMKVVSEFADHIKGLLENSCLRRRQTRPRKVAVRRFQHATAMMQST